MQPCITGAADRLLTGNARMSDFENTQTKKKGMSSSDWGGGGGGVWSSPWVKVVGRLPGTRWPLSRWAPKKEGLKSMSWRKKGYKIDFFSLNIWKGEGGLYHEAYPSPSHNEYLPPPPGGDPWFSVAGRAPFNIVAWPVKCKQATMEPLGYVMKTNDLFTESHQKHIMIS